MRLHHARHHAGAVRHIPSTRACGIRACRDSMAHIELSRDKALDRRRAGNRGLPGEARARTRRRPALDALPRARMPARRRARDEPADVGERGDPAQRAAIARRRRRRSSAPRAATRRAAKSAWGGCSKRPRSPKRSWRCSRRRRSPACACSSPRGRRSRRSTRCAASPTRAPARWASRSRARRAKPAPR